MSGLQTGDAFSRAFGAAFSVGAMTRHARTRANQRGVRHDCIRAVLDHADVDAPVGSGCSALSLSRRRLDDLSRERRLRAGLIERLGGLTLIRCDDTGDIVTVMHRDEGGRGRRYRRAH